MFDYETKPSIFDSIKIGRITFSIFTALEWWIFVYLLLSKPTTKAEGMWDMFVFGFMLLLLALLSAISVITTVWLYVKGRPHRFWLGAAIIAAAPFLVLIAAK